MRNTTAAGVESAPVLQSASAWVLSRLAVLPARGRMAIRMATATGITRRRPTIHPHRPIMHRGVAGIRITGATTPAESGIFGEAEPRWRRRGFFLRLPGIAIVYLATHGCCESVVEAMSAGSL